MKRLFSVFLVLAVTFTALAETEEVDIATLTEAAEAGDSVSQVSLARLYRDGIGVDKDYTKALALYKAAALQGSDDGSLGLGILYYHGLGVDKDPMTAVAHFRRAAEQNNASAMNYLGHAYQSGIGVELNLDAAIDHYKRATDLGNAVSATQLGQLYFLGTKEMKPDYTQSALFYTQALNLFRDMALEGGTVARKFMLKQAGRLRLVFGTKIARHEDIPMDGKAFAGLLAAMVEWGDNPSLGVMILMYKDGIALEKSEKDALKWLLISEAVVKKAPHLEQIADLKAALQNRLPEADKVWAQSEAEAWKARVLPAMVALGWEPYD